RDQFGSGVWRDRDGRAPLVQRLEQTDQQLGPRLQGGPVEMLLLGMGTRAVDAETVQCRNAEGRGKVSVAEAARDGIRQRVAEFRGQRLRLFVERADGGALLIGRPVKAACDLDA